MTTAPTARTAIVARMAIRAEKGTNAGYMERMSDMELKGVLKSAGFTKSKDGSKDVFKAVFQFEGQDKEKSIWTNDSFLQAECARLIGKHITGEFDQNDKWLNLVSIKASEAPKQSQTATQPVTVTTNIQPRDTRQESIESQNALTNLTQLIIAGTIQEPLKVYVIDHLAARIGYNASASPTVARKPVPEGMFPKGDSSPTVAASTAKMDFVEACVKAGYNPQTKQGQSAIKAWMLKAGKTNLPFDELSEEKQAELIHMMKCQELAE